MQEPVVIRADNVSKTFKLPHERVSSVKSAVIGFYRRRRSYEIQQALKDINFEIKQGEFFGIVGRNGSGKSTLLKILAGIYQPSGGKVYTHGKIVPFIELGVGFNPELTGRDNVYLNGALLGFSRRQMEAMYEDIVSFAELGKFMDQKLKNYSSGMEVRLAFSLAIRAKADILLIDEVLAVGDADFQRKCFRYFNQLKREKKTVILVTHEMDAVREYCDRAMLIDKQRVVKIGHPEEVAREYLKITMPKESQKTADNQTERWGDKTVQIKDIKVTNASDDSIEFRLDVMAKKDCPDPVYGFRIRNSGGQSLVGTNSFILGHKPSPLKKGQKISISWKVENIFTDGDYYIDPSVVYEGTLTAADWWDGAATFNVSREKRTPYFVEPKMKVSLEE